MSAKTSSFAVDMGSLTAVAHVSWPQVHAFRMARHSLTTRAPKRALVKTVGAVGGVQAQVMSAAELQTVVRIDASVTDVRHALWTDRVLVKTWLMRGTLHLVPAADLPSYAAAFGSVRPRESWLRFFGMSERDLEALIDAVGAALSDEPMTKDEIVAAVGTGRSRVVREWLRSGWGGLLKPVARRGLLCFGPSRGTSVTFVRPSVWLRDWREVDPEAALADLARRYLRAYGPATKRDFARWSGPSFARLANASWSSIADERVPVSVDGDAKEMLASDVDALVASRPARSVRLLPLFDPYLMGHASRDHLFDRVHAPKVSRTAGWISAVVLVDGRVTGTWTHEIVGDALRLHVVPFAPLAPRVASQITVRAREIAHALGVRDLDVHVAARTRRST